MDTHRLRPAAVSVLVLLLSAPAALAQQSLRLEPNGSWKSLDEQGTDKFLAEVAQIKKMVNAGQTDAAVGAIGELKKNWPEIAEPQLDAFFEAEMLLAKGRYLKAARKYDEFLDKFPESTLYEAAVDRQFAIGRAFLAGRKIPVLKIFRIKGYAQGAKIMDRITDRVGQTPLGVKAQVAAAKSLEKRKKFDRAYQKWSQIWSRSPVGRRHKEALLAMARCKHAAYKGPKYDATGLISAKSYYEQFSLNYPEEAEKVGIKGILEQINEQLAYKEFTIARYYERTASTTAANLYYQMVMDKWPESAAARMANSMQVGKK